MFGYGNLFSSFLQLLFYPDQSNNNNNHPLLMKNGHCVTDDNTHFIVGKILEPLSLDIVIEIVQFLDRIEFIKLSRVNKFFNALTEDHRFWLQQCNNSNTANNSGSSISTTTVIHTTTTNSMKIERRNHSLLPIFNSERIQSHLNHLSDTDRKQLINSNSFKTLFKSILLSPFPSELNQVANNHSGAIVATSVDTSSLIPVHIFLLGQLHSGRYSLGICSTRGYSRPSDKKSVIGFDFFAKRLIMKRENLSNQQHCGAITGIGDFNFVVERMGISHFKLRGHRIANSSINSSTTTDDTLSIMYTIDLSIKENYFLNDFQQLLYSLFKIDISLHSPSDIRKRMGNCKICLIGTKSDIREMSSHTLAKQLVKIIDTSCEFWEQTIIYIETSSKNRENMDHPYLFFAQTNIHSSLKIQ